MKKPDVPTLHRSEPQRQHLRYAVAPLPFVAYLWLLLTVVLGLWCGVQYYALRFPAIEVLSSPLWTVPPLWSTRGEQVAAVLLGLALLQFAVHALLPARRGMTTTRWLLPAMALMTFFMSRAEVYRPWELLLWQRRLYGYPPADRLFYEAMAVIGGVILLASQGFRVAHHRYRHVRAEGVGGTARWGRPEDYQGKQGLVFGKTRAGRLVAMDEEGHAMAVASTGSNKGVSLVLPNLLHYPGSVITNDPKGENFAITARYRAEGLGHQVHCIDPFGTVREFPVTDCGEPVVRAAGDPLVLDLFEEQDLAAYRNRLREPEIALAQAEAALAGGAHGLAPADAPGAEAELRRARRARDAARRDYLQGRITFSRYNPMDAVSRDWSELVEDATILAEALVETAAKDPTWEIEARKLLRLFILVVASTEHGTRRTLYEVYRLMSLSTQTLAGLFEGWTSDPTLHPEIRNASAQTLSQMEAPRYFASALGSALTHVQWLASPAMREVMQETTFNLRDLKQVRMTLYLVLPPNQLTSYRAWFRLLLITLQREITRLPNVAGGSLLMLIDEFAMLGTMRPILDGLALLRGYQVRYFLFLQDLAQLRQRYDDWETVLGNVRYLSVFGVNDNFTAGYVSRRLGKTPKLIGSTSKGNNLRGAGEITASHGSSLSENVREHVVDLLNPDQVQRLDPRTSLLLLRQANPLHLRHVLYYDDQPFKRRASPSPFRLPVTLADEIAGRRRGRMARDRRRRTRLIRGESALPPTPVPSIDSKPETDERGEGTALHQPPEVNASVDFWATSTPKEVQGPDSIPE